jgi:general stress protein YciG
MAGTKQRGFASMDEEKQREIASLGGRAAHQKGTAHKFTPEEARAAGRKGGETVSRNREHMARIGRKGGQAVSRNREHMAQIGRKGGESSGSNRDGSDLRASRSGNAVSQDEREGMPSR